MLTNKSKELEFKVYEVTPIGLESESQSPRHINLIGELVRGTISAGESYLLKMTDSTQKETLVLGLHLPFEWARENQIEVFSESISAEKIEEKKFIVSIRMAPQLSKLIALDC